jgi:hypothetical protein
VRVYISAFFLLLRVKITFRKKRVFERRFKHRGEGMGDATKIINLN